MTVSEDQGVVVEVNRKGEDMEEMSESEGGGVR